MMKELRHYYVGEEKLGEHPEDHHHHDVEVDHLDMNSNTALLARESIKFSPKIRAVLRMIWIAADWDGSNSIDYAEYKWV